jgi:hypothetical protein
MAGAPMGRMAGACLTRGEKLGIHINYRYVEDLWGKGIRCLVGRLASDRSINKESFKILLTRIWRVRGSVFFKEIQENLWLLEFTKQE